MCVRNLRFLAMARNDFSVLLFVPAAPKVLAETKRAIYTAFRPLIFRLKLSNNAIENKVYYDLATTLYYFSNKESKQIGRPEVIGVVKGEEGKPLAIERPPVIEKDDNKPYCFMNFSFC